MNSELTFKYDQDGDILYLYQCPPYADQEVEHLEDEVLVRLNPETDAIEAIEILFFSKRLLSASQFSLPILANLQRSEISDLTQPSFN
ncbi:MAG: DUF2283 domain-containing protein [Leptolyngbyaceae cyanobacterium]